MAADSSIYAIGTSLVCSSKPTSDVSPPTIIIATVLRIVLSSKTYFYLSTVFVTPSENSGHVAVPKAWIGKEAIVTLKGKENKIKGKS
jgi:putative transposon-encoded protein